MYNSGLQQLPFRLSLCFICLGLRTCKEKEQKPNRITLFSISLSVSLCILLSVCIIFFHGILKALRVEWQDSTPSFAALPERRNENIKYIIPLNGNGTHNRGVYSRYAPAPRRPLSYIA